MSAEAANGDVFVGLDVEDSEGACDLKQVVDALGEIQKRQGWTMPRRTA